MASKIKLLNKIKPVLKISLSLIGIIFALFLLEQFSGFQEKTIRFPIDCYKKDFLMSYTHSPNKNCRFKTRYWDVNYSINSQGLRDNEYPLEKNSDTYRILFLGDSFVEGLGVEQEDTFVKKLENHLNQDAQNHKYEVINAGVAGYSPLLEYFFLKNVGLNYNPDLVILVYEPFDYVDDISFFQAASFDEEGEPVSVIPYLPPHIIKYLENLARKKSEKQNDDSLNFPIINKIIGHSSLAKNLLFQKNNIVVNYDEVFFPDPVKLQKVTSSLEKIRQTLSENKIEFQIVSIPLYPQLIYNDYLNSFSFLDEYATKNDILHLNISQDIKNSDWEKLFLGDKWHYNELGNDYIAQILFNKLNLHKAKNDKKN